MKNVNFEQFVAQADKVKELQKSVKAELSGPYSHEQRQRGLNYLIVQNSILTTMMADNLIFLEKLKREATK